MGIVVFLIRERQGLRSLPEAIQERYGSLAAISFGLAVLFRLYQEVCVRPVSTRSSRVCPSAKQ